MLALALCARRTTWLLAGGALAGIASGRRARVERFASRILRARFLRLSLWRAAWAMAQDHPLWGVRPDNFLYYYSVISCGAEVDPSLPPHNLLLDFWLRLGASGAAIPWCSGEVRA